MVAGKIGEGEEGEAGDSYHNDAAGEAKTAPAAFLLAVSFQIEAFADPDVDNYSKGDDDKDRDNEAGEGCAIDEFGEAGGFVGEAEIFG